MPRRSARSASRRATSRTSRSDSMTQGPAINSSGRPLPQVYGPMETGLSGMTHPDPLLFLFFGSRRYNDLQRAGKNGDFSRSKARRIAVELNWNRHVRLDANPAARD